MAIHIKAFFDGRAQERASAPGRWEGEEISHDQTA